jgi:hypothetical protein
MVIPAACRESLNIPAPGAIGWRRRPNTWHEPCTPAAAPHRHEGLLARVEQQLRLVQAVDRVESVRQTGDALSDLRARCEAFLDLTAPRVDGDARLRELLDAIRTEVRDAS